MMSIQQETPAGSQSQDNLQPGDLLCRAVSQGDLTEVQRLLAAGVDVNGRGAHFNLIPLMLANSVEMQPFQIWC